MLKRGCCSPVSVIKKDNYGPSLITTSHTCSLENLYMIKDDMRYLRAEVISKLLINTLYFYL